MTFTVIALALVFFALFVVLLAFLAAFIGLTVYLFRKLREFNDFHEKRLAEFDHVAQKAIDGVNDEVAVVLLPLRSAVEAWNRTDHLEADKA